MLKEILSALAHLGWSIEKPNHDWYVALNETKDQALFFAYLSSYKVLLDCPEIYHNIKKRDAFIFCPEGVTSEYLRQSHLRGLQAWFLDGKTGATFPYPPTNNYSVLNWVVQLTQGDPSQFNAKSDVLSTPARNKPIPIITYILLTINLLIFILMTLAGGSTSTKVLILFGAKVNELILMGEIWRFLTSMFIHIGFLHLAFNLYALWALGTFTEELLGRARFLLIYLISGVGGGIMSFLFSPGISAGASGAIFGLLGALLIYTIKHPELWKSGLGLNLIIVIAINFGLGFLQPQIDIYAHLGGFFSGISIGLLQSFFHKIQS